MTYVLERASPDDGRWTAIIIVYRLSSINHSHIIPIRDLPLWLVGERVIERTAWYNHNKIDVVPSEYLAPGRSYVLHGHEVVEDALSVHVGAAIYKDLALREKPIDQVAAPGEVVVQAHRLAHPSEVVRRLHGVDECGVGAWLRAGLRLGCAQHKKGQHDHANRTHDPVDLPFGSGRTCFSLAGERRPGTRQTTSQQRQHHHPVDGQQAHGL